MKKILFVIMASVAITFASCNGGTSKCDTLVNDSDSVAVDTTIVDSLVADSAVAK